MVPNTADKIPVADVALDPRTSGSDAIYTYHADSKMSVGDAVIVPLGPRTVLGFVVELREVDEHDLGFPFSALKPVQGAVRGLSIPASVMSIARAVAEQTLCSLPTALSVATPPGVRERLVTSWVIVDGATDAGLTPTQREVFRVMTENRGSLVEAKKSKITPAISRALRALKDKGVVEKILSVSPVAERQKNESMIQLCGDSDRIEKFLTEEGRKKPAQALTLIRLQEATQAQFSVAEIRAISGVTEVTVKALVESGLLHRVPIATADAQNAPVPNSIQQIAIDRVVSAVRERRNESFLLYGVTGSGKTEVYLRAAAEVLRTGRQVLYVVPEIALAAQVIGQLRRRFGRSVAVLHSELAAGERLKNWIRIRQGITSVVVGARSALFAPIENLGLVILDEEHEGAYKQENAPRYHAKRVALHLGQVHSSPVILGSATPSVESYQETHQGKLSLLSLPYRAAEAKMPEVEIEDLTLGYRSGKPSILSDRLATCLHETLERGEQAILFLNRRAYAPFLLCRDCGHQMTCPDCDVSLSFHRKDLRLRCHHCGFQQSPPDQCPKCGGNRLNPFGIGTEKVEEAITKAFPDFTVGRLDRDVTAQKGALEETLAAFRSGETKVLVGTQMVAKGLDFPNVTLVGVIAADLSLSLPDFRSTERTFQLMSQVAGRAGRGQKPGRVVIQTFNPEHPAIVLAQRHDYERMFEVLRLERDEACYPPFSRLVNLLLTSENRALVAKASKDVANALQPLLHANRSEMLGPVDCTVERIQRRWRRHILLKMPPDSPTSWIGTAIKSLELREVQFIIDVDPYSTM